MNFAWLVLAFAAMTGGCALDLRMQVGKPPNNLQFIDERLTVGKSTADDVLALLGPPRGRGSAMLPIDPIKRLAWSYTYIEGSVQTGGETKGDMRSLILFVFFEQERYVGYYWFSSL